MTACRKVFYVPIKVLKVQETLKIVYVYIFSLRVLGKGVIRKEAHMVT